MAFWFSLVLCFFLSVSYVLGLHLIAPTLNYNDRDLTVYIVKRMWAAGIVTILIVILAPLIIPDPHHLLVFRVFGFESTLWAVASSLVRVSVLMSLFYLGPLVSRLCLFYDDLSLEARRRGGTGASVRTSSYHYLASLGAVAKKHFVPKMPYDENELYQMLRNLVAAPISEEIVFRGVMVAVLRPFYKGTWGIVFVAPLFFAPAHLHHALVKMRSGFHLADIVFESLLQLTYTYIFACIATLFLLRTGNIWAPILAHMICNYVGLPNLGFMSKEQGGALSAYYSYRWYLLALHGIGLVLFVVCVLPFTEGLNNVLK